MGGEALSAFIATPHCCRYCPSSASCQINGVNSSNCSVAQSCLTLRHPLDCSSPGSFVHGIFQAGILEWVAIPFSRGSNLGLLRYRHMTNLDSILKSRDITLPTNVCLVKAMVFPVVMYGCESWTIVQRI